MQMAKPIQSASITQADKYDDSEYYFVKFVDGVAQYEFFGQSQAQVGGENSSLQQPQQLAKGEEMRIKKIGIEIFNDSGVPLTTTILQKIYQVLGGSRLTFEYSGRDQGRWSTTEWLNSMMLTATPATAGDSDNVNLPNFVQRWKTLSLDLPLEQQYGFGFRLNCFGAVPDADLANIKFGIIISGTKTRRK